MGKPPNRASPAAPPPAFRAVSIRLRALLAVLLLVGFYALALGMAGGLLWIPWAEWTYAHRIHLKLLLFCVIGAFLILKAVLPRPDRFEEPGPRLTREAQPRLFALLEGVARDTGQTMPSEVYLVADVNAWVAERGGVLGVGSRRVMGIGLALLEVLRVDQLRAVIAHEFGHYIGGDTRLGPWVYRTRVGIERTLEHVGAHSGLLAKPFHWYGLLFLRVSHAVSRRQEFVADAVAARVAGAAAARDALLRIGEAAPAFGSYWRSELAPVLERGYRPPFAAGFGEFRRAPSVAPGLAELVATELREGRADPYDTHPSLRERVAAIDALPPAGSAAHAGDDAPALALLDDVDAVEAALVRSLARAGAEPPATASIAWEAVPETVIVPSWRELVAPCADALAPLTPEALPRLAEDTQSLADRLRVTIEDPEVRGPRAEGVVGGALALLLHARAGDGADAPRLHAPPGEPVTFRAGGHVIAPFAVVRDLAAGALSADAWAAQCAAAGIAGASLAAGVVPRAAVAAPDGALRHAAAREHAAG